jgi:transcription elongation GreA/GreB family factor
MNFTVSKYVFDFLLDHMLDIHRRKMNIVSPYTIDYDSYMSKLNCLNGYIRGIEAFLEDSKPADIKDEIPFVIIGSTVHLRAIGTDKRKIVKIILPKDESHREKGVEAHHCFSEWGHELMLKKPHERVHIEPGEEHIVESIYVNAALFVRNNNKEN